MRYLYSALAALMLVHINGCASPEIVQISPDTYMLTRSSAAGMFANMSKLKAGVIQEAIEQLATAGVVANHLHFKWIVPFHADEAVELLSSCKRTILIENNYSGLFHRYMRGETGFTVDGHIRKYDGEPFKPHHIVTAVQKQLEGEETLSVPYENIIV